MPVLDGRSIVDKKMVTFSEDALFDRESQIQPNGIDLRIEKLYTVLGSVHIPQEGKAKADLQITDVVAKDGHWKLQPGQLYYVDFFETINVPAGWCAKLITRSSLVRAGVDVVSGLWDTGWVGRGGCTLRVHNPVTIDFGAKLCQIMFFDSEFRGQYYSGSYLGTNSQTAIGTLDVIG